MTKTARGTINGQGNQLEGHFETEVGSVIASIKLTTPVEHLFEGRDAVLEYDDVEDLFSPSKIESGSVIGPAVLRLLLVNESRAKVTITAHISPPLPSALTEGGTAIFIKPE
ncbi:hypothetical protein GQ42DRAFT_165501 [Ramicandelaber brevisporus]|nr:hypothetical protein GQ42DRAFT_165501 [Ramicandelaber brevisporus]